MYVKFEMIKLYSVERRGPLLKSSPQFQDRNMTTGNCDCSLRYWIAKEVQYNVTPLHSVAGLSEEKTIPASLPS